MSRARFIMAGVPANLMVTTETAILSHLRLLAAHFQMKNMLFRNKIQELPGGHVKQALVYRSDFVFDSITNFMEELSANPDSSLLPSRLHDLSIIASRLAELRDAVENAHNIFTTFLQPIN